MTKFVVNCGYGGFSLPAEVVEKLGLPEDEWIDGTEYRQAPELIEWVRANRNDDEPLTVVDVPDGYTDYRIEEYDGWETLWYVLDGKMHWAEEEE